MNRREFSKATRRAAFCRALGQCDGCGQKLFPGNIEYHHAKEDFMGGEPTLENCVVLCRGCHRAATGSRAPVLAKTRRQADRNAGIARSSRPMNGGKHSRFKRKVSGEVVLR